MKPINKAVSAPPDSKWRRKLFEIIFEADTKAGKAFDVALILVIAFSVSIIMLDSVKAQHDAHRFFFKRAEWCVTGLFTIEYILRISCVKRPARYIFSFFGIVDLLSLLPTFISLFFPGKHYLAAIRLLRLLRIFRVLKLVPYASEAQFLWSAMIRSRRRIGVFLFAVLIMVTILGSLMYVVEGPEHGFDNIPASIYWAIVTITTVGFGDITPGTAPGQFIAATVMILGYSIIAVPIGIFAAEMLPGKHEHSNTQVCRQCGADQHDDDAHYCKTCGMPLFAADNDEDS